MKVLRFAFAVFLGVCFGYLLRFMPGETRLGAVALLALGAFSPQAGLCTIALLGALFLRNTGAIETLLLLDALVIGILYGVLLNRETENRRDWAAWPFWIVGVVAALAVAALPSLILTLNREIPPPADGGAFTAAMERILYGAANDPEFGLRTLFNWLTAMGIAVAAARLATPRFVQMWLLCAVTGAAGASFFGFLDAIYKRTDEAVGLNLVEFRPYYYTPWHRGRLQGTADHPGWFGEWLLVAWPGAVVLLLAGGRRLRSAGAALLAVVLLALVWTGARAAWVGFAAAAVPAAWYLMRRRAVPRKTLLIAGAVAVLLALVAVLLGGEAVRERVVNLARLSDRRNYIISGLIFLREHPWGLGLGTHRLWYEHWFTPMFRSWQFDYTNAHSLYMHTLVEGGPALFALCGLGVIAAAAQTVRRWGSLSEEARLGVVLLGALLAGLLVDGLAQYFLYVRPLELAFWIAGGLLVGLLAPGRSPDQSRHGLRYVAGGVVLLIALAALVFGAPAQLARPLVADYPRPWGREERADESVSWRKWTGTRARLPIDTDMWGLRFGLYRDGSPAEVRITWPEGHVEEFTLQPGEGRRFARDFPPVPGNSWWDHPRWLTIEAAPGWVPAEHGGVDTRPLGVWLHDFLILRGTPPAE